jgi:thiol peroxidase
MKKAILIGMLVAMFLVLPSCRGITERVGAVTLEGQPLTLIEPELRVGQKAPDFRLLSPLNFVEDFTTYVEEVTLSQSRGRVRLVSVVPSIDTPVCDRQTQQAESVSKEFGDVAVYTISMDLPFALARFCGEHDITNHQTLSDYRGASFGTAYGVLIKDIHLLSRAIFIIDRDDTVRYVDYASEISRPPDFDRAIEMLS